VLIKFTSHGKGDAQHAVDYLLQPRDAAGVERAGIQILDGDPERFVGIANGLTFAHRYKSCVLAFAKEDKPTPDELQAIYEDYKGLACAGVSEGGGAYTFAVRHDEPDGGCHLHILIPCVDLTTGKHWNTAPPGWAADFGPWKDGVNARYGFADPDDPSRARGVRPVGHEAYRDAAAVRARLAEKGKRENHRGLIEAFLKMAVMAGEITTHADILAALREVGTIRRNGQTKGGGYITIEAEGGQKIRLKGALFEESFDGRAYRKNLEAHRDENHANRGGRRAVTTGDFARAEECRGRVDKAIERRRGECEKSRTAYARARARNAQGVGDPLAVDRPGVDGGVWAAGLGDPCERLFARYTTATRGPDTPWAGLYTRPAGLVRLPQPIGGWHGSPVRPLAQGAQGALSALSAEIANPPFLHTIRPEIANPSFSPTIRPEIANPENPHEQPPLTTSSALYSHADQKDARRGAGSPGSENGPHGGAVSDLERASARLVIASRLIEASRGDLGTVGHIIRATRAPSPEALALALWPDVPARLGGHLVIAPERAMLYTGADGATHFFVPTPDGPAGDAVDLVARHKALTRWEARKALFSMALPTAPLPPLTPEMMEGIARYFRAIPVKSPHPPYTVDVLSAFHARVDAQGTLILPARDGIGLAGAWVGDRLMGRGLALGWPANGGQGGRIVILGRPSEAMAHATLSGKPEDAYICIASPDDVPTLIESTKDGRPVVLASADTRYLSKHLQQRFADEIEPGGGWRAELERNPPPPTEPPTKAPGGFLGRARDALKTPSR
jgi:hypothetical protein